MKKLLSILPGIFFFGVIGYLIGRMLNSGISAAVLGAGLYVVLYFTSNLKRNQQKTALPVPGPTNGKEPKLPALQETGSIAPLMERFTAWSREIPAEPLWVRLLLGAALASLVVGLILYFQGGQFFNLCLSIGLVAAPVAALIWSRTGESRHQSHYRKLFPGVPLSQLIEDELTRREKFSVEAFSKYWDDPSEAAVALAIRQLAVEHLQRRPDALFFPGDSFRLVTFREDSQIKLRWFYEDLEQLLDAGIDAELRRELGDLTLKEAAKRLSALKK